jgi:transcriptional regulator with XRE-family HTH domain
MDLEYIDEVVANCIRSRRKLLHMQQHDLAAVIGITRTSISNIEHGRQALSLIMFCKIAIALELNPGELLNNVLSKKPKIDISEKDVKDPEIREMISQFLRKQDS